MNQESPAPTYLFVFRKAADRPDPAPEQMQKIFEQWMSWMTGLKARDQFVSGDPLEDHGRVFHAPRGASVTDGPFAEAKEIVSGFILVRAGSFDAAAEIARDCPGLLYGGSVEVRQIMPIPM